MAQGFVSAPRRSNAYNMFILVLTMVSLVIMVAMFLPLNEATIEMLRAYDVLICFFFLVDFFVTFRAASSKTTYFIKERGWLDLVGSIATFRSETAPRKFMKFFRTRQTGLAEQSYQGSGFHFEAVERRRGTGRYPDIRLGGNILFGDRQRIACSCCHEY